MRAETGPFPVPASCALEAKAVTRLRRWLTPAMAGAVLFALAGAAQAALVRFHYVPADDCGTMTLKPDGSSGTVGERVSLFGAVREGTVHAPRPNYVLTFRQPYTGKPVTVPVALPLGTPRIEYRTNWVIYNYGSYAVEIHFLADGSVDVVYNSGLFRAP